MLSLILKNSWRNRRRTIFTVLSIGASLCLLGLMLAIYHAFYLRDSPPEQALRLVTRNKVSLVFPMPEAYLQKIRQVPGVREASMYQWFGGVYKDNRDSKNLFAKMAVEPEKLFIVRPELRIPEEQKEAFKRERTACVAGKPLADRLNWKLGDRITIKGDIFPVNLELTLRGIFDAAENNESLYFQREYLNEGLQGGLRGNVGMFWMIADSPDSVPRIARTIDDQFRNSPVQTKTEPERAFALAFVNSMANVKAILLSICAAVTFTILLVSANTMAMSVRERVREVGVLKTLGFTPGAILSIILGEAAIISAFGGVLGCALAAVLCMVVRRAPTFVGALKTLSIQPSVAGLSLLIAVSIGIISSLVPAWNASRTRIVDALRSTD